MVTYPRGNSRFWSEVLNFQLKLPLKHAQICFVLLSALSLLSCSGSIAIKEEEAIAAVDYTSPTDLQLRPVEEGIRYKLPSDFEQLSFIGALNAPVSIDHVPLLKVLFQTREDYDFEVTRLELSDPVRSGKHSILLFHTPSGGDFLGEQLKTKIPWENSFELRLTHVKSRFGKHDYVLTLGYDSKVISLSEKPRYLVFHLSDGSGMVNDLTVTKRAK